MKVKKLIPIVESTLAILRYYENTHVQDMLKDIQTKIKTDPPTPAQKPKPQPPQEDYSAAVTTMKQMDLEQIEGYLKKFKKQELIGIGKQLGLKLSMKDNKPTLIDSIINYFSLIQLNGAMANRKNR